ncbi:active regulator of SIRT1 [Folsomia candida]|uniref:Active regulator of SIRT1 n=1 Tax=Folsomia candida TaxID=158441 RepID=A0A226DDL6_FOLCA|nr:active regulator of SIRT1 [Folsomia candida]OXA43642.1 Active regulator of SIRT1 [Folsomia candida]
MSAALVRKALEVSEDTPRPVDNSGKRKLKSIEKKKKSRLSSAEVLKKNLKILKALEFSSRAKKYGKISVTPTIPLAPIPAAITSDEDDKKSKRKNKKGKKNKPDTSSGSAFTEEDFLKFEKEYFVTD